MGNAGAEATAAGGAAEGPGAAADAGTEEASGVTTATDMIPMPASEAVAAAAGGAERRKMDRELSGGGAL